FTKTWHSAPYPYLDPTKPSNTAEGKTVLITGGGKGIGKEIALTFAKARARAIVIIGRTETSLLKAKSEIELEAAAPNSLTIHAIVADISDAHSVKAAFSIVKSEVGLIDICVQNAGYLDQTKPVVQSSLDDYWRSFEINVKGGVIITQEFLNGAAAENATLINITSGAAHLAPEVIPAYSAYSASKLALFRIMEFVNVENPSLRVFNLQPGAIATDMAKKSGRPTRDDITLPAAWCVWAAASQEADFLRGRFVWANWDVTELLDRKAEILEHNLLSLAISGL
ncbi:NAD(P)-binding protein, partial [Glonium stellatum]